MGERTDSRSRIDRWANAARRFKTVKNWPAWKRGEPSLHVRRSDRGEWGIWKSGADRAEREFVEKDEALKFALGLAITIAVVVILHHAAGEHEIVAPDEE